MIRNAGDLITNGASARDRERRRQVLGWIEGGLRAVDPGTAVERHLVVDGGVARVRGGTVAVDVDLAAASRVVVLGGGKATTTMATTVERILGKWLTGGVIVAPEQVKNTFVSSKIHCFGGGHPVPNEEGLRGVDAMIDLARGLQQGDVAFCLLSGGGSALMPRPVDGISLADKQALNKVLLSCGATIHEINTVRKHVSSFKGGWLARHASPATVIALVLSDVVGDDLATIASGPTEPDPTTFADATRYLHQRGAWEAIPASVRAHLAAGLEDPAMETPKPGDASFNHVTSVIVGSAATAASEIVMQARAGGMLNAMVLTNQLEGEARLAGTDLARLVEGITTGATNITFPGKGTWFSGKVISFSRGPDPGSTVIVLTGETTVKIQGRGTGGRNQEMLLGMLAAMEGKPARFTVISCGMDGIEGNSPAAGAIIDEGSASRARARGLDPTGFLDRNDSHAFFSALGDAIITGPTGTNVNDVTILLVDGCTVTGTRIDEPPG